MKEKEAYMGMVVRLNSGGPKMTVSDITEDGQNLGCVWMDEEGVINEYGFKPIMLQKVCD